MKNQIQSILFFFTFCIISSFTYAQYTKLCDLGGNNGCLPTSDLYFDGNYLYGMTQFCGANDEGVMFKIDTAGANFTKILDFSQFVYGKDPWSSFVSDGSHLYGTTFNGGSCCGTVFRINPDGTGYVDLHNFNAGSGNGQNPMGTPVFDGTFLYGTTGGGGQYSFGAIYKVKTDGTGFSLLHDFSDNPDGRWPSNSLTYDGTYLYGMTSEGGVNGVGIVFKIMPDGSNYMKLLDFDIQNGKTPRGTLICENGVLYGMTNKGGTGDYGVIFSINTDGTGYTKLLDFDGLTGAWPYGAFYSDGTYLYAMTYAGGTNGYGTIFKIKPDGSGYSILHSFGTGSIDGIHPYGSLISDGSFLYGMTTEGGTTISNGGTVFKYKLTCMPITVSQSLEICRGESVIVGSNTYSVSGTYTDVFTNATVTGCDSTVVTNLTVLDPRSVSHVTICQGQSITVGSHTYSDAGTYLDTLISYQGCDSIITTQLTVLSSSSSQTQTLSICSGDTVFVGTDIYTTSGTYTFTYQGNSCDSTIITNLTVVTTPTATITGNAFTCGDGNSTIINVSGGGSYLWNTGSTDSSIVVSPAADTVYSVVVANGSCLDSSEIYIQVFNTPTAAFYYSTGTSYYNYIDSSYSSLGDNIVSWEWYFQGASPLNANIQNPTHVNYGATGNHEVCLKITTIHGCIDSICKTINIQLLSLGKNSNESAITIYPNPYSDQAIMNVGRNLKNASLTLYDSFGRQVMQLKDINEKAVVLRRDNLSPGIYFLQLVEDSEILYVNKLIISDN